MDGAVSAGSLSSVQGAWVGREARRSVVRAARGDAQGVDVVACWNVLGCFQRQLHGRTGRTTQKINLNVDAQRDAKFLAGFLCLVFFVPEALWDARDGHVFFDRDGLAVVLPLMSGVPPHMYRQIASTSDTIKILNQAVGYDEVRVATTAACVLVMLCQDPWVAQTVFSQEAFVMEGEHVPCLSSIILNRVSDVAQDRKWRPFLRAARALTQALQASRMHWARTP